MSFNRPDLSALSYGNGFTLWHYKTIDASVIGAGYFNGADDMLNIGDVVIANLDTDGTLSTVLYMVSNNASGVVTIAAL